MNDEQPRQTAPALALTDLQRSRIGYARQDLESTRAESLPQLDAASLILIVEKLRRRLDDALQLLDEVTQGVDEAGRS